LATQTAAIAASAIGARLVLLKGLLGPIPKVDDGDCPKLFLNQLDPA
jgi:hypothetical protein